MILHCRFAQKGHGSYGCVEKILGAQKNRRFQLRNIQKPPQKSQWWSEDIRGPQPLLLDSISWCPRGCRFCWQVGQALGQSSAGNYDGLWGDQKLARNRVNPRNEPSKIWQEMAPINHPKQRSYQLLGASVITVGLLTSNITGLLRA